MRKSEKQEHGQIKTETSRGGRGGNLLFRLSGGGSAFNRAKISSDLAEYKFSACAAPSRFIANLENKPAEFRKNLKRMARGSFPNKAPDEYKPGNSGIF